MSIGVLFDMDGVIADTIPYHKKAWIKFCKKYNCHYNEEDFNLKWNGKKNKDIFPMIFNRPISDSECESFIKEKENLYFKIYEKHAKPVKGLIDFLKELKKENIKIALATSAPDICMNFVLDKTKTRNYFKKIITGDHINKAKPDPEVFLKAGKSLGLKPEECIVIEDGILGTQAGINAGMKVIAITTTHKKEEFENINLTIDDFTQLNVEKIKALIC